MSILPRTPVLALAMLAASCAADPPSIYGPAPTAACASGDADGTAEAPTPVALHGALSVSGTGLVDEHGAPVQLKGPSSMWLNWETTGYARNCQGLQFLRDDWKATVIRAAMGVEPGGAY